MWLGRGSRCWCGVGGMHHLAGSTSSSHRRFSSRGGANSLECSVQIGRAAGIQMPRTCTTTVTHSFSKVKPNTFARSTTSERWICDPRRHHAHRLSAMMLERLIRSCACEWGCTAGVEDRCAVRTNLLYSLRTRTHAWSLNRHAFVPIGQLACNTGRTYRGALVGWTWVVPSRLSLSLSQHLRNQGALI